MKRPLGRNKNLNTTRFVTEQYGYFGAVGWRKSVQGICLFCCLLFSFTSRAQEQTKVDFKTAVVAIELAPLQGEIKGRVTYEFEVLAAVDSIFLDAKAMQFSAVHLDAAMHSFEYNERTITLKKSFKKGTKHQLTLDFLATPKQTVYFLGWHDAIKGNEQVWTQGQGKYTSHWLPSFDDMNEKVVFDLSITTNAALSVMANGKLITKNTDTPDDKATWVFDMQHPMSSYLLAFAVGRYKKQQLVSASGVPIENYYYPEDASKVEPTYRYTKEIFDFLETEIGVPYPWQNYKQIPVRDFLYAGMENTGTTIFSDGYVVDSTAFVDKNYVNVNAHELAHQWFGNLVTEQDGNHHWLHEGFATYYAYLTEQQLFGDEHFYWKLYNTLQQLKAEHSRGEGQALLNPKASSLTFYEKGAWALFMLRNKVGDVAFRKGVVSYLKKFQFTNVTVADFLLELQLASGLNLEEFRQDWLESSALSYEAALRQLAGLSPSIKLLTTMEADLKSAQSDDIDYLKYWKSTTSIPFKIHLLQNYLSVLPFELIDAAYTSDHVLIRQALVMHREAESLLTKEQWLTFLNDKSYVTQEKALLSLWKRYPEERKIYLDATKAILGLPNKGVRHLWLFLAMLSENYNNYKTKEYFDELGAYTSPSYSFEIRQSAFFYLKEVFMLDNESLKNLVKATNHHAWQFRKFARNLFDEFLKDEAYKARLINISKELNSEELRYMNTKLKE